MTHVPSRLPSGRTVLPFASVEVCASRPALSLPRQAPVVYPSLGRVHRNSSFETKTFSANNTNLLTVSTKTKC